MHIFWGNRKLSSRADKEYYKLGCQLSHIDSEQFGKFLHRLQEGRETAPHRHHESATATRRVGQVGGEGQWVTEIIQDEPCEKDKWNTGPNTNTL